MLILEIKTVSGLMLRIELNHESEYRQYLEDFCTTYGENTWDCEIEWDYEIYETSSGV